MSNESELSWVVGSADGCDIVIDNPSVSGQHCCLRSTGNKFRIEDLSSTNGTYVNGHRIQGPQIVSAADTITLGKTCKLPWPTTITSVDRTITIGAADDNDVVLHESVISGHHAQLLLQGNQWVLEDLGSTNGTFLGSKEKRITSAPVNPDDTVFLGSYSTKIRDLIASSTADVLQAQGFGGPFTGKEVLQAIHESRIPLDRRIPLLAGSGALVCIVAVGLLFRSGGTTEPSESEVAQVGNGNQVESSTLNDVGNEVPPAIGIGDVPTDSSAPQPGGNETATIGAVAAATTAVETATADQQQAEPSVLDPVKNALFLITVEAEGASVEYAAAWAAGPKLLITSGTVIASLQSNKYDSSAMHINTGAKVRVVDSGVHPLFETMYRKLFDLTTKVQELTKAGESEPKNLDQIRNSISELKQELPWVERSMDCYDIGWLHLAESIDDASVLRPDNTSIQPGKLLKLANPFMEKNTASVDADKHRSISFYSLQARERVLHREEDSPIRWACDFAAQSEDHEFYSYDGCPIVNPTGKLIGMFRGEERRLEVGSEAENNKPVTRRIDMVPSAVIDETLRSLGVQL